ncbi:MAG: tRNA pseudouridine(55) synthase TruB [Deltaproteobacteria bacterium]|nr:tRNA pseudouridine(55) synthase TruB [Deltaproteobacteria bacterium]
MSGRRPRADAQTGVLELDKPRGWTSHDVVARVRRIFGQREVGHTGTLDPMATGLLVLTLGRATRISRFIEATEKTYEGVVALGSSTTTWDAEGDVVEERPVPKLTAQEIEAVAASLRGNLEQEVPAFSAVKVQGERLYARARRGDEVVSPRRWVRIESFDVTSFDGERVYFRTRVSKGTYVRSLAVQFGAALSLPAHLASLRRTAVGARTVGAARNLASLEGLPHELSSMADALAHLPTVVLSARALWEVAHGRPLTREHLGEEGLPASVTRESFLALRGPDGALAAVGISLFEGADAPRQPGCEALLRYACVLAQPDTLG